MQKKAFTIAIGFSLIIIGFFVIFSEKQSTRVYSDEERLSGIWISDDKTTVEFSKYGHIHIYGETNIAGNYTVKEDNIIVVKRNDGHTDITFEYSFSDDYKTLKLNTFGYDTKVFTKKT